MSGSRQIEAVTFDFWDTLVIDDSDEVERARRGLPTKEVAREALFVDSVLRANPAIPRAAVTDAWAELQRRFRVAWKDEQRTPTVSKRLNWGLDLLDIESPPDWEEVIDAFERMEFDIPPDPAPGVEEALRALSGRYRLGIISDTIVTPAYLLRRLLSRMNIELLFRTQVFSDEAGRSKPAPRVYAFACAGLDVAPSALLHVGDREETDVLGAQRFGARAALYTGVVDRGSAHTAADLVCTDLRHLPDQIAALSARSSRSSR